MNRSKFIKSAAATIGLSALFSKARATYLPTGNPVAAYIQKPTANKKLLIFGDSISEVSVRPNNWPSQITNLALNTNYNYSVGGARYKNFGGATANQQVSDQIAAAITDSRSPDYIIFVLGTNDQELSMGSYATAMGKATLGDLDKTLLYEALRYAYWKCSTQWSTAIQFAVLPFQRADVDIAAMSSLRTAIISMANRYNVKLIDGTYGSGIISDFEVNGGAGRWLSDGVHPSTSGSALVAKLISSGMISQLAQ